MNEFQRTFGFLNYVHQHDVPSSNDINDAWIPPTWDANVDSDRLQRFAYLFQLSYLFEFLTLWIVFLYTVLSWVYAPLLYEVPQLRVFVYFFPPLLFLPNQNIDNFDQSDRLCLLFL